MQTATGRNCWDDHLAPSHSEGGFTLVELLVVVVIIPLVIGAISVALISVMTQQSNVSNKVSDSQDTQQISASFVQDIQTAFEITTNPNVTGPIPCGSHPPVLSLWWGSAPQTVVSYAVVPEVSGNALFRYTCTNGGSTTPTAGKALSYDVQSGLVPVLTGESCQPGFLSCKPSAQSAANSDWAYTAGIEGVTLNVTAQFSGDRAYQYTLVGVPRESTTASRGAPPPGHATALSLGGSGNNVQCNGSQNATLTVNGALQINSNSSTVASTNNNGSISADQINVGSTSSSSLSGNESPNPPSQTGVTVTDPYAGLAPPVTGLQTATLTPGMTYQGMPVYAGAYQGPGIYVGSLNVPNNTTTILASGIYVLMNGISLTGNQSLATATTGGVDNRGGVLLYAYRGTVSLAGNGTATLSPFNFPPATYAGAPSPWPGIVIWQDGPNGQGAGDPGDSNAVTLVGNGNGNVVNGTVYAPLATVGGSGNGSVLAGSVVAAGLSCNGNGNITIG
jgi:prepilin-type N-terminal cleavage/methylation domain-containing protein